MQERKLFGKFRHAAKLSLAAAAAAVMLAGAGSLVLGGVGMTATFLSNALGRRRTPGRRSVYLWTSTSRISRRKILSHCFQDAGIWGAP